MTLYSALSVERKRERDGRYAREMPCDGCGKPVLDYGTDDEVCGGGDGPGFYLCHRKRCGAALEGKTTEERRAHYTAQRAKNDARRRNP